MRAEPTHIDTETRSYLKKKFLRTRLQVANIKPHSETVGHPATCSSCDCNENFKKIEPIDAALQRFFPSNHGQASCSCLIPYTNRKSLGDVYTIRLDDIFTGFTLRKFGTKLHDYICDQSGSQVS